MPISIISNNFMNFKEPKTLLNKLHNLNSGDIIIYTIYLPDYIDVIPDLDLYLNPEEVNRAERFHKKKDKNRFVLRRSLLKFVLAAHSNSNVNSINIEYLSNKKPFIRSNSNLFFNVSHSEDFAVIAVSSSEVGIDVEYISKDFEFKSFLNGIFNDSEIAAIENADDKKHAFYTSWTRKEAFAKALGKGIDDSFKQIPCLDGNHILDLSLAGSEENWQVNSFELFKDYVCSIAYNGEFDSKKIEMRNIPNTMNGLLKLTQIKHL